jgi:uncharacterized protein (DUF1810 family)
VNDFKLERFFEAQEGIYSQVLDELRAGEKQSHWMWFIFPQVVGLGKSESAQYYAIKNLEEAHAYLSHEILGHRLQQCSEL